MKTARYLEDLSDLILTIIIIAAIGDAGLLYSHSVLVGSCGVVVGSGGVVVGSCGVVVGSSSVVVVCLWYCCYVDVV